MVGLCVLCFKTSLHQIECDDEWVMVKTEFEGT